MIPALTIRQPFASAIMAGVKPVENRTWAPASQFIGERLYIHAGKTFWGGDLDGLTNLWPDMPDDLPRGVLLGHVLLLGVVPVIHRPRCPWSTGPLCWLLDNPILIDPIPVRGSLKLFDVGPIIRTRYD